MTMWVVGFVLGLSQKKIIDFFRIQKGHRRKDKCSSPQGDCLFYLFISVLAIAFRVICIYIYL